MARGEHGNSVENWLSIENSQDIGLMKYLVKRACNRIMKFDTFRQERSISANMPISTHSPADGGQNIESKQAPEKWDVLNLTSTWFLTNNGTPVLVDGSLPEGATDDQWRELIERTGVRMTHETLFAHWGQYRRCAFLNWCEVNVRAAKRPRLFHSKEAAIDFEESKRIEISESE